MLRIKNISIYMMIFGLLSIICFVYSVKAETAPVEFYVDPPQVMLSSSTSVGYKFNITVYWNDTGSPLNEVYAYQVNLQYNATLLNCTRAWRPTWDSSWLFYGKSVVGLEPSLREGEALVGDTLLGVSVASSAHSPLAVFELEVLSVPPEGQTYSCILNIDNVDTYWLDADLNEQTPTRTNGTYIIPEFPQNIALLMVLLTLCFTSIILSRRKLSGAKTVTLHI